MTMENKPTTNKSLCLTYECECFPDNHSRKVPSPQEVCQPATQRNDKESSVGNGRVHTAQNCRLEAIKLNIIQL